MEPTKPRTDVSYWASFAVANKPRSAIEPLDRKLAKRRKQRFDVGPTSSHSIDRSSVGPNSIVSIYGSGQARLGGNRIRLGPSTSINFTSISRTPRRASAIARNAFRHLVSDIHAAENPALAARPAAAGSNWFDRSITRAWQATGTSATGKTLNHWQWPGPSARPPSAHRGANAAKEDVAGPGGRPRNRSFVHLLMIGGKRRLTVRPYASPIGGYAGKPVVLRICRLLYPASGRAAVISYVDPNNLISSICLTCDKVDADLSVRVDHASFGLDDVISRTCFTCAITEYCSAEAPLFVTNRGLRPPRLARPEVS